METEKHFLLKSDKYDPLKKKHDITEYTTAHELIKNVEQEKFGKYLVEAFAFREETLRHTHET